VVFYFCENDQNLRIFMKFWEEIISIFFSVYYRLHLSIQAMLLLLMEQLVGHLWTSHQNETLLLFSFCNQASSIFKSVLAVQANMWKYWVWIQNFGRLS